MSKYHRWSNRTMTLYHGTSDDAARALLDRGWEPNKWHSGGQCGQTRYLYLTNMPENAKWFAEEKGSDTVVVVKDVPIEYLEVDPEDGVAETVEEELSNPHGLPGNVVLTKALPASHFSILP